MDDLKRTQCRLVVGDIMSKQKYMERLEPLFGDGDAFDKACRGYAIGMFQKRGFAYDQWMVNYVCSECWNRVRDHF